MLTPQRASLNAKQKQHGWFNFNVCKSFLQPIKISPWTGNTQSGPPIYSSKRQTVGTNIPIVNDKHMNLPKDIFIML